MITIQFERESVCMADDVNAGKYIIKMSDFATLGDLIEVLYYGGNGNTRAIPMPTAGVVWLIDSNIGHLAELSLDENNDIKTEYITFHRDTPLCAIGIDRIFAKRP